MIAWYVGGCWNYAEKFRFDLLTRLRKYAIIKYKIRFFKAMPHNSDGAIALSEISSNKPNDLLAMKFVRCDGIYASKCAVADLCGIALSIGRRRNL